MRSCAPAETVDGLLELVALMQLLDPSGVPPPIHRARRAMAALARHPRARRWILIVLALAAAVPIAVLLIGTEPTYLPQRQPPRERPPSQPRPFSRNGVWNRALPADAAIDPNSASLVSALAADAASEQRDRTGPFIQTTSYGVSVYNVGPEQPTVPVRLDARGAYTRTLRAAFRAVPLPRDARPAAGTDGHLVVWQRSTDSMWEFFRARRAADGWHAAWGGAMRTVSRNPGYFSPRAWPGANVSWGASATSLPLLGGLITPTELAHGVIKHALAIALPAPRIGVAAYPAERTDGTSSSPDAIPEGARLRLDPRLDLKSLGLPRAALTIARAAQRYGLIVRDRTGHAITFYAEDPTGHGDDPYPILFEGLSPTDLLARFPWDKLQVTRMRLHPDPTRHLAAP